MSCGWGRIRNSSPHRQIIVSDITPQFIREVQGRATCIFTDAEVQAALDDMARQITASLKSENPLLLCVMTGAITTVAELARRLDFPLQIDYLHASRYGDNTKGTELRWFREPVLPLAGRHVLIVDDILDQGATLAAIVAYCKRQQAASVRTAVLVNKHHARKLDNLKPDFQGLDAEDFYLYGYGMDYRGYLRNAAGIYAIDEKDY